MQLVVQHQQTVQLPAMQRQQQQQVQWQVMQQQQHSQQQLQQQLVQQQLVQLVVQQQPVEVQAAWLPRWRRRCSRPEMLALPLHPSAPCCGP
jgi:hypothetical protein